MANTNRISKVPVASLGGVTDRVITTAKESKLPEVIADSAFTNLEEKSKRYTDGLSKRLHSKLTNDMVVIDKKRDSISRRMDEYVSSLLESPIEAMHVPARRVYDIIERYPNVESEAYADESKHLRKMIAELRDASLKDDITLLNLKPWIDALEAANEEFEAKIIERGNDLVAIHEVQSATTLRRDLEKALRDYFEFVHALVVIKKTEEYKTFEKQLLERVNTAISPLLRDTPDDKKQPS
ncbi:DUF6261 family protein [uncultured Acetobacteroides sp.]|uniref:DUF6261 family protein n=1 Tax=uncultured Acetobacteroides sp. TaxID=1760811 RepID=UPI0029F54563|nr:DUF6261 family protein [uncultured Acetobacteroides sp.]